MQVAFASGSTVASLGPAGAIAALLGAYVVLYPRGRFLTLLPLVVKVTFVEQPAWLMVAVWLVATVLLGALGLATATGSATGLAITGQIGGLAFGALVALALSGRAERPSQETSWPHDSRRCSQGCQSLRQRSPGWGCVDGA